MTTVSSIYFAACLAAERELPPASKALIVDHDALQAAWRTQGYPSPVPAELQAASAAIAADPLASVAMAIRRLGNEAWREEREAARAIPPAAPV